VGPELSVPGWVVKAPIVEEKRVEVPGSVGLVKRTPSSVFPLNSA